MLCSSHAYTHISDLAGMLEWSVAPDQALRLIPSSVVHAFTPKAVCSFNSTLETLQIVHIHTKVSTPLNNDLFILFWFGLLNGSRHSELPTLLLHDTPLSHWWQCLATACILEFVCLHVLCAFKLCHFSKRYLSYKSTAAQVDTKSKGICRCYHLINTRLHGGIDGPAKGASLHGLIFVSMN